MSWKTYAERLEEAGISWKVYQEQDNFGDNSLEYFSNFQEPGTSLYNKARTKMPNLVAAFKNDIDNGTLPQVSWICAPEALSEHSSYSTPVDGEDLSARLLAALIENPDVWSKTVFFINYDENGGIFDHISPPVPPCTEKDGYSSISTDGEIQTDGTPTGLGFRVPMLIVSPWSRGGWVCSQVFDHTSVIRFMEARFGVKETNISAWRRAITGDLTSAFDFRIRNLTPTTLPTTDGYRDKVSNACSTQPYPVIPSPQVAATQEHGTRPARPIPYEIHVTTRTEVASGNAWLDFYNVGNAVSLDVYPAIGTGDPQRHTLGRGVTYRAPIKNCEREVGRYATSVYGPNGFFRLFKGNTTSIQPTIQVNYDININCMISLKISNPGGSSCEILVADRYGCAAERSSYIIQAGATLDVSWMLGNSNNWYDLTVTLRNDDSFMHRYAGHIENGLPSTSEPAGATPVDLALKNSPFATFGDVTGSTLTATLSISSIIGYATTNIGAAAVLGFVAIGVGAISSVFGGIGSTLNTIGSLLSGKSSIWAAAGQEVVTIVAALTTTVAAVWNATASFVSKAAAAKTRLVNTTIQSVGKVVSNVASWIFRLFG